MAIYLKSQVGRETLGVVMAELTEAKSLWHGEVHSHAAYELQVMLGGSSRIDVEGKVCMVQAHEAILTAPNLHHRTVSVHGDYVRYGMLFSVEDGPLADALAEKVGQVLVYPVTEEIEALCGYIFLEWDRRPDGVRTFLQNQAALLLQANFRQLGISAYGSPDGDWPSDRRYTHQIDTFFSSHLAEEVGLEQLAEELHLSHSQVNRIIKEHYGITFREKMVQARMARAAWLLNHTDCRVEQIAAEVGYHSVSSFHKMFRARFGLAPEEYRERRSD